MNRDDFNRDPVDNDEFFGELADMIELADSMTQERLSGGELDRRREEIMSRVRRNAGAKPADDIPPVSAARPTATADARRLLDGDNRLTVRITGASSRPHARPGPALDAAMLGRLSPVMAAALADAERYRDSALRKAADIVKQAQLEADGLRAEAQRILDDAHRSAAAVAVVDLPGLGASPDAAPAATWSTGSVSRGTVVDQSHDMEHGISLVGLGSVGRAHAALGLLAPLDSGCDERWPADPSVPMWGSLLRHTPLASGPGDVAADFLAAADHLTADGSVWQVKYAARPDDLRDQWRQVLRATDRLWWLWRPQERPEAIQRVLVCCERLPAKRREELGRLLVESSCGGAGRDGQERNQLAGLVSSWSALRSTLMISRMRYVLPESYRSATAFPRGATLPILSPVRRVLLACDVAGFGQADAGLRSRWQRAVQQVLDDAARQVGLDSGRWQRHAADGGELAVLPIGTPWRTVFDQLLGAVDRELREYNLYATDEARLRLRVAVHEGVVTTAAGVAGQAATTVTRLVDAAPLKQALDAHPTASMAVAVSDLVYQDVTHGRLYDGDRYLRVTVPQAMTAPGEAAWVFVPDENMRFPDWTAPSPTETETSPRSERTERHRRQDEAQLTR
ncbi:ATP synthase F0 subunit B [Actinoplanes sp. TBRC 11911]|uniref:hypothetical protein n=1 Tax=Actinoplanes sp. TBRC 11911 TaxID=2729386 RepID=UPI00145F0413|nr:hypothetical protein [Actinoplanes sp. TBRC 11911]NMO51443.1 ATP synthase F0 subunit B [Actinoplanes sp. TBRC 11911]